MRELYSGPVEESDESPLEREELTLPDGRRLLLYTAPEEEE
jgi:hypothetical protein